MIEINVTRTNGKAFKKFITEFPEHADTIANAVADAFARHAADLARSQNWPSEAAPSMKAWRENGSYYVRPGHGITGLLNFLNVFERSGTGWPHRPVMRPAVGSFDTKTPAITVYNRIVRKKFK